MDCEILKPSGSPSGTVTDEDITAAEVGNEFAFELTQSPLRYIRIVINSTFGGTTFTHPADVDFYGEMCIRDSAEHQRLYRYRGNHAIL